MTSERIIVNKEPIGTSAPKQGTKAFWLTSALKSLAFEGPSSRYDLAKSIGVSWAYVQRLTKELLQTKLAKTRGRYQGPKHTVTRYSPTAQGLFALRSCDWETERNWTEMLERNSKNLPPEDYSILKLDVPPMITENDPRNVQPYFEALLHYLLEPETLAEDIEDTFKRIEDKTVKKRIILELTNQASDFKRTVERNKQVIQNLSI
ncbi:hypothetical protein E6H31_00465 [Candidatus Bathyarchaeota archaeon]|nr:MAG: hypothetical protein E6H31_00465 [Candidatus Bathyarchaeota archaeon]